MRDRRGEMGTGMNRGASLSGEKKMEMRKQVSRLRKSHQEDEKTWSSLSLPTTTT